MMESLVDICLEYLSGHTDLLHDARVPSQLCDQLLHVHTSLGRCLDYSFARKFANTAKTKIRTVRVRSGGVTSPGLACILKHELSVLDCSWCAHPLDNLLDNLDTINRENLVELSTGPWKSVEPSSKGLRNCPNLKKLEIYHWTELASSLSLSVLLAPLTQLVSLNLNEAQGITDLSCLTCLPNLRQLYLYNVVKCGVDGHLPCIRLLTQLTHLDVSGEDEIYPDPDTVLEQLVESLPHLVYLDVSGTNLAGRGVVEKHESKIGCSWTDIIGLRSRSDRHLQFLGLFDTRHGACQRPNIPAKIITGDGSSEQLMQAARTYMDRPMMLEKVLNEIYSLARDPGIPNTLFEPVLVAMERYVHSKMIQISASASLFFVVKNRDSNSLSTKTNRRIVRALLNGMILHKNDQFMLRNGCLCLCQFNIHQELMFEYERLVEVLLYTTTKLTEAVFVQRIAIYLLNSLACQVDSRHKHILGEAGAVPKMLTLIEMRVKQSVCDDVLEVAWSTLWNVTDETPLNCQYFLDSDGMDYFCACLELFPDKAELLRNMMGLLGNVAEVAALRPRLMTNEYLQRFTHLLLSESDGIEVSYNAAGVLAHMCSDGPLAWSIHTMSRQEVLQNMQSAINKWDISAERNINYRSFVPILSLLQVDHTPECQHWAAWALANLTKVYPSKYCTLVESEGGLRILGDVASKRASLHPNIAHLCNMVIEQCQRFKHKDYCGVPLEG